MDGLTETRSRVLAQLLAHETIARIQSGEVGKDEYIRYVSDVYYYAQHSSQVIGHSASRLVSSHPKMADYLFTHAKEELGHDEWARGDLADLGLSDKEISTLSPSYACQKMVAMEYFYACQDDPVGLFGWMYVLECLGGDAAGGLAKGLDNALELNGKGVYFLAGHAEADAHHSEDLTNIISNENLSEYEASCVQRVIGMSIESYLGILDYALTGKN